MAKKNLKAALGSHHKLQAQKERARARLQAEERKAASVGAAQRGGKKAKGKGEAKESGGGGSAKGKLGAGVKGKGKGKEKLVMPFGKDDTILLVGEGECPILFLGRAWSAVGNFSFTLALLTHRLPPSSASLVVATALDDEETCYYKYPDAQRIVSEVRRRGATVLFGVDAGALDKCKDLGGKRFSVVAFNFPHAGAGLKDQNRNILTNQLLLLRFFSSVAPFLTEGPPPSYAASTLAHLAGERRGSKRKRKAAEVDSDDEAGNGEDVGEAEPDEADWDSGDGTAVEEHRGSTKEDGGEGGEEDGYGTRQATTLKPFVPPNRLGRVLVTVRNSAPYTLWDVPLLAKRGPSVAPAILSAAPSLPSSSSKSKPKSKSVSSRPAAKEVLHPRRYAQLRSFEFHPRLYPGYAHRRTIGFEEGLSKADNEEILRGAGADGAGDDERSNAAAGGECRTWEFAIVDRGRDDDV